MIVLVILLSLIFFFFCCFLIKKENKKILFSLDNIIVIAFALLFSVLFPVDYFYSIFNSGVRDYLKIISEFEPQELLLYYTLVALFLLVLIKTLRKLLNKTSGTILFSNSSQSSKTITIATYTLLILGIISDYFYLRAYGGYFNYLKYSAAIRSGANDFYNPFSFLIYFRHFISFASIIIFSLSFKNKKNIPFFVFSFVYSLFIFYADKGRLSLALYLIVFPLFFILRKTKSSYFSKHQVFLFAILSFVFLSLIVFIGSFLSRSSNFSIAETIISESSFLFANMRVLMSNNFEYRLFGDIISYPLYLLPSSIWRKVVINTPSDVLTILISGSKKGTNGIYGECPIDFISLSYMQLGIFGVFIVALIAGVVLSIVFNVIDKNNHSDFSNIMKIYLILSLALRSILYGDSYNIVQRMFPVIAFSILFGAFTFLFKEKASYIVKRI